MQNNKIRVASVPASHVYVRHLSVPGSDETVVRLPDPAPADGRTVPGGWWPPVMLDPAWIAEHHDSFDVFHVHFGFDAIPPATMAAVIEELDRHHKPLVYTLHDLRNPHHPEPGAHEAVLDLLVPAADAVITLTPGAADAIAQRWHRKATVLPHPHVLPRERFAHPRCRPDEFTVGVHAKSVRANMDPLPVVTTLLDAAYDYDDVVVQVNVHDEIGDPDDHWYNPGLLADLTALEQHPRMQLVIHPYFSDDQLWDYLDDLAVSVLPYRFGTHSGWLEACHDLGTAVIAPSCGFYQQQQPCHTFTFDEDRFDATSLARALDDAYTSHQPAATWEHRRAQRMWLSQEHDMLYRRVLDA